MVWPRWLRAPRSIRWRLLLSLLWALALMALVVGGMAWRAMWVETQALFDYQLKQMALSLREQGGVLPQSADGRGDEPQDFVVQIWSLDGRTLHTHPAKMVLPEHAVLGFANIWVAGEVWRSYVVMGRGQVIQVAQPERVRRELAMAAALRSVAPIAWLALPLAVLLWWVVAGGLRPLRQLAHVLTTRDAASLQPLPRMDLPEELSPLATSINGLLVRLDQALQTQRAFVADAAHELRSPLTALKLQWQLLRRSSDEVTRTEAVNALGEGIERAARLVEQLLVLARSEPQPASVPGVAAPVEMVEVARRVLVAMLPLAQARQTQLELDADGTGSSTVMGDAAALEALVRNVVDNAIRYSPPASRVRVEVRGLPASQQVDMVIEDNGPGLPLEERTRVFDRFYRGSTGRDTAGSGLGLAIVQAVAQRHGATVQLEDGAGCGLKVRVTLPAISAPSSVGASEE